VQAALQQALLPRFEYPPIARRRGWEGRVKVGLHVGADGDLTRIHLVESSGYALLDSAAVKNVTELRNVPGAAQWIDADSMEVVLPVRYRLHNR
jgi:protein TonB